jgi:hypothetical protein
MSLRNDILPKLKDLDILHIGLPRPLLALALNDQCERMLGPVPAIAVNCKTTAEPMQEWPG